MADFESVNLPQQAGSGGNNPGSTGAPSPSQGSSSGVPSGLQKFVDSATGTVDLNKLEASYKEAEGKIATTAQEKLEAERAYEELARRMQGTPGEPGNRPISFEDLVKDPQAATSQVVDARLNAQAKPIIQAVLEMSHPEIGVDQTGKYKNPVFMDGLKKFSAGLPANVQQALKSGDYATANWVLGLYKKLSGGVPASAAPSPAPTNFSESAQVAAPPPSGGKIWTRSEIRNLVVRDPKAYSSQEAEIRKAYEEGRVKLD
jgi:hypothetical protein